MSVDTVELQITGFTTLIMQADTLADPLAPQTKAFKKISSKRVKTDADHEDMARMEFFAGLYLDEGQIVMPSRNVKKCLIEGAKVTKAGKKIERAVQFNALTVPLTYDGPKDPEKLYANKAFVSRMTVVVNRGPKTIRVRPQFVDWALSIQVLIDTTLLSIEEFRDIAANAGKMEGLGTYRATGGYGRFTAEVRQLVAA
jgi:hypothetical protein